MFNDQVFKMKGKRNVVILNHAVLMESAVITLFEKKICISWKMIMLSVSGSHILLCPVIILISSLIPVRNNYQKSITELKN